jgi:hypothetical protein
MLSLHTLPAIPKGEMAVFSICLVSAIFAALVPGLDGRERLGALVAAPVVFALNYFVARLLLPLMGGTAAFGTKVAVTVFYLSAAIAVVALASIPFWLLSGSEPSPAERAYYIGSSAPGALGWAAAAIHRYRRNTGAA